MSDKFTLKDYQFDRIKENIKSNTEQIRMIKDFLMSSPHGTYFEVFLEKKKLELKEKSKD